MQSVEAASSSSSLYFPKNLMGSFWGKINPNYRQKQTLQKAQLLIKQISDRPLISPQEALIDPLIRKGRSFSKALNKESLPKDLGETFQQVLLAARLGVPVACLQKKPSFADFAKRYFLYNFLGKYNQTLQYDEKEDRLWIRCQGHEKPILWEEVPREILDPLPQEKGIKKVSWKYGPEGLQNKDFCHPDRQPFMRQNPEAWNRHYLVQVRVSCVDHPRFKGDHAWICLKNPQGEVYARGKMGKDGLLGLFGSAMKMKNGWIEWPDSSELWGLAEENQKGLQIPSEIKEISFKVEAEDYGKALESFWEKYASFHLFHNNCYNDVDFFLRFFGVSFPTRTHALWLFAPQFFKNIVNKAYEKMSLTMRKILRVIFFPLECISGLFLNLILLLMGASKVHQATARSELKVVPYINRKNWWKIFSHEFLYLNPPFAIVEISRKIEAWREIELSKLRAKKGVLTDEAFKQEEDNIVYGLPSEYRTKFI